MEHEVEVFLRERGVDEDIIQTMKEHKFDKYVIGAADDSTLSKYLPLPGDRIAVKQFCTKDSEKGFRHFNQKRKSKILTSLREKLKLKRRVSSGDGSPNSDTEEREFVDESKKKYSRPTNNNAERKTRKIEIGWLNFDYTLSSYRQVRKRRGGGTRNIYVPKDLQKDGILNIAKDLFFPDNRSPQGELQDFDFDILDFSETPVSSTETIVDMYERTAFNMLRFYLASKKQDRGESENKEISTATAIINMASDVPYVSASKNTDEVLCVYDLPDLTPEHLTVVDHIEVVGPSSSQDALITPSTSQQETFVADDSIWASLSDDEVILNFNERDSSINTTETPEHAELNIHRGPLALSEMCSYFKDPGISQKMLTIIRVLPNGNREQAEDTGGVLRDLLTEFWLEFYARCTVGRDIKVPCLRHDFGSEDWTAVARILVYGWENSGYWPTQLSQAFIKHCLFASVPEPGQLIDDFLGFVALPDKDVFCAAMDNFENVPIEDLYDSLEAHDCRTAVKADNLKVILLEMAHKELIQMPMYVCDCWRDVIFKTRMTTEKLKEIYQTLAISNKKVTSMLEIQPSLSASENDVAKYLKRYIRELTGSQLQRFLRFCTGSDLITVPKINVEFCHMETFSRRPIAHTCGCVLMLSNRYDNFMEFRADFNSVLESNIWVMDIV